MRFRRLTWMSVLSAAALAGCAGRGNLALLEDELRRQEDRVHVAERELATTRGELEVARREAQDLRQQMAQKGQATLLPEQADILYRAVGIKFNSLLTAGIDRDDVAGDDLLSVSFYPHDQDGALLKLPGQIEIRLVDLTAPPDAQELASFEVTAQDSTARWHAGFLASGFLVEIPWQQTPTRSDLTVQARFVTTDGRAFAASTPVQINLAETDSVGRASLTQTGGTRNRNTTRRPVSISAARFAEDPFAAEEAAAADFESAPPGRAVVPAVDTSDRRREWEFPTRR